jgi:hypothetical protein
MQEEEPLAPWARDKKKDLETWPLATNPSIISYIVIHHSLTADGATVNWDAIRKFHTSWRFSGESVSEQRAAELKGRGMHVEAPWKDVGYHFGVENVKDDYLVMQGRPLDMRGAHVGDGGFNQKSIGICLVGNFDKTLPPEKQWLLSLLLVARLQAHYAAKKIVIPNKNVIGHREAQALAGVKEIGRKSCPGNLFDMDKFSEDLTNHV